jgi:MAP/microtubule affinity-regulating kinase
LIIKLEKIIQMPDHLILIFPFQNAKNLKTFFYNNFVSRHIKFLIFLQIVRAIKFCHSKKIAHRDIKLDNIIIDKNRNINLIDLGYSIQIPEISKYSTKKFCGTPLYMAPEVISKKQHNRKNLNIISFFLFLISLRLTF